MQHCIQLRLSPLVCIINLKDHELHTRIIDMSPHVQSVQVGWNAGIPCTKIVTFYEPSSYSVSIREFLCSAKDCSSSSETSLYLSFALSTHLRTSLCEAPLSPPGLKIPAVVDRIAARGVKTMSIQRHAFITYTQCHSMRERARQYIFVARSHPDRYH